MAWHWIHILPMVLLLPSVLSGQCKSSTYGREFVFGILDTLDESHHGDSNIVALDITNVSPADTTIRVLIPYFSNDTTFVIPQGEKRTIEIDPNLQQDGTFVDKRAISIFSDNDISVIVTNAWASASTIETYNILPVNVLGNRFIISSAHSINGYYRGGVIMIAGTFNNTNITLYNQTGRIYTTVINSNDIFQYLRNGSDDITGVRIVSDKNIFVVSGSTYAYIPRSFGWDCIGAAMIPTSAWSNRYIVPPVIPKRSFMIRILSEHDNLNASIVNSSKTTFTDDSRTEHYFQNECVVVVADQSFSVTQYGVSNQYDNSKFGDAFMAVVPSIDQYLNDYIFTVPHGYYDVKYYAAVIVPDKYKDGLLYDSISKQSYKYAVTVLNVPPPLDDYIVLTFQVDSGFHHFRQTLTKGNFGLFVYGLGFYSDYGLGDCLTSTATTDVISTHTPSETMTLTSRRTEAAVYTMVAASTTDTSKPTNGSVQLCFVCADLSHIDLCERVEQCNQNEVCYLEKYMESGHTKYKSGCIDARTCQTKEYKYSHSDEVCFECCNTNYCNNKGCGEDIPDRDRRGPICFDCEHVSSPDECFKVFPCNSDEVCRIEEYKWFGHSNFKMGCGQGVCDPVQRAGGHRFKRATPVCLSCCAEDFCNRNCTHVLAGQGGSIIVVKILDCFP